MDCVSGSSACSGGQGFADRPTATRAASSPLDNASLVRTGAEETARSGRFARSASAEAVNMLRSFAGGGGASFAAAPARPPDPACAPVSLLGLAAMALWTPLNFILVIPL